MTWLGAILSVVGLLVWSTLGAPSALVALQSQPWFKIGSGSLLALAIAFQWLLSFTRAQGEARLAKRLYRWHDVVGAFMPLILLGHSKAFGFGYLAMLSGIFWINTALAFLGPSRVAKLRPHAFTWLVAHIACSVVVSGLAAYHAWTALLFE